VSLSYLFTFSFVNSFQLIRAERQTDNRKSGTVDTFYNKVKVLELICEYKLLL